MTDITLIPGLTTDRPDPLHDRPHRAPAAAVRADRHERPSDRVELSDRARYLSKLAALPDVRTELVDRVRREIQDGSYETDQKLDAAVRNLADDLDTQA